MFFQYAFLFMLFFMCFGYLYLLWTPFSSIFMILWWNITTVNNVLSGIQYINMKKSRFITKATVV